MEKIWLLLLVPVLLLQCFMPCLAITTPTTNLATDEAALLALKAHITTPHPYNVLAYNWSSATSNCCSWIGVTCGHRHQRVTGLNLSDMGLTGTIPPHIGNLSFLASLIIRNTSFHGHLPHQLSFLHRLKIINLRLNNFNGQIPSWIGLFPKLQTLTLSNNSFSGSIPSSIYNMSSLQFLSLASNNLSIASSLPTDMCSHLPELEHLYLSLNQLYGQIPSTLYKCRRLQTLVLWGNKITGSIPREIGNLTMLKVLDLGYNHLGGEIPQEMGNLIGLKFLNIGDNGLTGPISSTIFNNSSIEVIDFSDNNLSGSLPEDIIKNYQLNELYLSHNQLSGPIPREIGNLTAITELSLDFNNFIGEIPHELGDLDNLVKINLDSNGLSGSIPPMIFNISTIEMISLSNNSLSGELPQSCGLDLPNLNKLYLHDNKLSGRIPTSITNASKLTILEVSLNSFTGFIPDTLGYLRFLEVFNVGFNSLTTESAATPELRFLTSLTNCQYLRFLSIQGNQLNGKLPNSVGNFTSLEFFYVPDCGINSHIPKEIGNLTNLIMLTMSRNQLTGSIPPTVGKLQNLQGLYLYENKLEGSIPSDLCLLRSLVSLYLYDNELSGLIPPCIGNLTSLLELRLNSNKLISTIPSTLSSLTGLLKLNLSSNSLIGNLPLEIGSLKVVIEMDISMNHLSGNIPSVLGSLQNLVTLSLAHNRLQGLIPPSLEGMISLELLDLSHNSLSGAIPKSLEKLGFLKTLNFSSNRLQGEIPIGGPFINFSAQSFMLNVALCGAPRFQVPPCKAATSRRPMTTLVLVLKYVLPAIVIIVLLLLLFALIRLRKRTVRVLTQTDILPIAWRRISYQEIVQATHGFSEYNLLGNGSFGSVYRGVLSDGMTVAIKVFNLHLQGAFKSFDVECEVLRNVRHRNLIKIISSCSKNLDFKALVLDYMPKESLEKWLYSHNYFLDILQRLNIMIDVALGLEYLHHGYPSPIIHCDLKPSNILLDGDMVAHVGDFGIAKLLGNGEFMKQTRTLATIGYMAPEYGTGGIVSTRGDVFSYGIMLMETFTRKRPTDGTFTGDMSLKRWVSDSLDGSITEVVDSNLLGREDENFVAKEQCASSVLGLAIECAADSPEERINMKDIVQGLIKIRGTLLAHIGRGSVKCSV